MVYCAKLSSYDQPVRDTTFMLFKEAGDDGHDHLLETHPGCKTTQMKEVNLTLNDNKL
jgi:hypothetical protein